MSSQLFIGSPQVPRYLNDIEIKFVNIYIQKYSFDIETSKNSMQPSELWRKVAEKAASEIMKSDFDLETENHENEQRIRKMRTSCAVTADYLWDTYQIQTQKELKIIFYRKNYAPATYYKELSQQEKNQVESANLLTYRFANPQDHYMTFIYDEQEQVWILLQSWQEVFSLGLWIRYPLLDIAKEVKKRLGADQRLVPKCAFTKTKHQIQKVKFNQATCGLI